MELIIDILLRVISHLPRVISFWLYSPERTKKNLEVSVSAEAGSVEIWCDPWQSQFTVLLDFRNNNPFPIEIDRVRIRGNLHGATMQAVELFGTKIQTNKKVKLSLEGKMDTKALEQVNKAPNDATLRLEVEAIVINKCHTIRDFRHYFDGLVCKFINRKTHVNTHS